MKKVLIITQTTNTNSGWGRYSFEIIKNLRNKVEVLILEEGRGENKLFKKDSFGSFIKNIFLTREVARKADIIHVLDGWPYAIYGYFAVLGTSKRLFINAVGTYSIPPSNLSIKSFLMKMAYKRASKVFSISSYTDGVLKSVIPRVNSSVVHLGVDQLPEPSDKSVDLVLSRINSRSPVILTVGALKKRKGQFYTLKAVSELKKDYPNILYVMVGDDSDLEYKKEIIYHAKENNLEGNILITGLISDENLSAWYKNSDIFALNSVNHDDHFEGFGLVIIEAHKFGLPAVGSGGCGIEDAILDGKTGYLSQQEDSTSVEQKIRLILQGNRDKFKKEAREFANQFSWNKTTNKYSEFYNS